MTLIASHDPCVFGPDIAGLSPPTRLWALVPDHEHSGKPSQACSCFAAGQPHATAVLMRPAMAIHAFNAMAACLLLSRDEIEQADASVIVGLWRLPNDDIMLIVVDLDGKFGADRLPHVLENLPDTIIKSNIISAPDFDAAQVSKSPDISPELAYGLKFFSTDQ